ncbi:protein accelerated cell death 6 [Fagus crenata]
MATDMNRDTYIAASTGVLSFFENLTASDSTFLQVTTEKNNVLHIAVQFNKDKVANKIICLCKFLAKKTNSKGNIPLHVAARVENPQMVRFLINHAEDRDVETSVRQLPRMVNLERDTALHIAVKYGNFEVVKELIQEDSELAMYVNKAGESVLFLAVDKQLYKIASHILSAAPRCSLAGRHGMNVLHALVLQTSSCKCCSIQSAP